MKTFGVRAIIVRKKLITMVEHTQENLGKYLILPGGGVEENETLFMAIEREVKEETNLNVKASKIMYIREVRHNKKNGIEFYILCKEITGTLKIGIDPELDKNSQILTDVKEITFEKLKTEKWFPNELRNRLSKDLLKKEDKIIHLGLSEI